MDIETIAWKKYENIKQDQEGRIKKLKSEQEEFEFKAYLLEKNVDDVDAITSVRFINLCFNIKILFRS